jgi:peptide/nickel transport system permease protein
MAVEPMDALDQHSGTELAPVTDDGEALSRSRLIWRRFRRRKSAMIALGFLVFMFALAFLGPLFIQWDYQEIDPNAFLSPPSLQHWFGTTQIGQDVFAQTLRGLQKSLIIGLMVGAISTSIAAIVGATAGYFGGVVERVNLFMVSLLLVLPDFLIIAIISPRLKGQTWLWFVLLLSIFSWTLTAMVVHGLTLSLRGRDYVSSARYMGVPPRTIISRHILPNMASFGIQPPDVSLGTLIAQGTSSAFTYPWLFAFSGCILVAIVLTVNVIGQALRDAIDPSSGAKASL